MGIKAVLFDLDGVVIDSEPIHQANVHSILEKRGISAAQLKEVEKHARGRRLVDVLEYLHERFKLQESPGIYAQEHRNLTIESVGKIKYMKGFLELIRKIRPRYKMALVTSGGKIYTERLNNTLSLLKHFDCVVTGEDTENGKPAPDPYLLACKKLGIKPEEAVAIEDTPNGIASAKAAGCHCIAVSFTFPEKELKQADFIAASFDEVERILVSLDA